MLAPDANKQAEKLRAEVPGRGKKGGKSGGWVEEKRKGSLGKFSAAASALGKEKIGVGGDCGR